MRVGILGPGLMVAKLGIILARARHEVVFSYDTKPDCSAQRWRARCGSKSSPSRRGIRVRPRSSAGHLLSQHIPELSNSWSSPAELGAFL